MNWNSNIFVQIHASFIRHLWTSATSYRHGGPKVVTVAAGKRVPKHKTSSKLSTSTEVLQRPRRSYNLVWRDRSYIGATPLLTGQTVTYASRAISKIEQWYALIEKEGLAIFFFCLWEIRPLHMYVYRKDHISVQSDYKPLEIILKKSLFAALKRLLWMLLRLQR